MRDRLRSRCRVDSFVYVSYVYCERVEMGIESLWQAHRGSGSQRHLSDCKTALPWYRIRVDRAAIDSLEVQGPPSNDVGPHKERQLTDPRLLLLRALVCCFHSDLTA